MTKSRDVKGPQFVRYFGPVMEALKDLGGSGRPSEVKDLIVEKLGLSDHEINETLESGASRFSNQVDWAKSLSVNQVALAIRQSTRAEAN